MASLVRRRKSSVATPNDSDSNQLTASGYKVTRKEGDTMRRLVQPWQTRAFSYYDIVPEIKYAAQFYSRSLAVLRLFVGVKDERGEIVECGDGSADNTGPVAPPEVFAQLERLQDPGGGGRSGLLGAYGRLMFLTGEALLFVSIDKDDNTEQWEMLSSDELRIQGENMTRYKAPSIEAENYQSPTEDDYEPINDDTAVAYRLWKRHPRFSYLADSTMQGVLDVCEELVLLTQAVRARAKSRLASSGILIVNGKVLPSPAEPTPDEDPEEDVFLNDLTDAMTAPIVDEGAASSVVPLVVRVDVEDIDKVMKHIQIVDPTQLYPETGLRYECVQRLAIGLDLPPEILTGLHDSNHWSAWQVDEQTWKAHLQPVAQQLVDDLTSAYFRPSLRKENVDGWQDYVISFDAAAIINHPDRGRDAKEVHALGALSDEALRDATGFDDEDAPNEQEQWKWIGIKLRDATYVKYGEPSVRLGGVMTGPDQIIDSSDDPAAGGGSADVKKVPPAAPDDTTHAVPGEVIGSLNGNTVIVSRILGASDLSLLRARELAGARLKSHAKRDKEAQATLEGVKASQAAATLGLEECDRIGAPTARQLVAGAGDAIASTFRMWGIENSMVESICARIEQHAARTLFDAKPAPMPQSFVDYIIGLHEAVKA